jgi:tryptophanyl-tRNA synthetase
MNLVTVSRLQRNPTVKTEIKMRNFEANIPVGFFCYPVSQAADIALFKSTTVPAGEDQEPMLEQTRELVRRFNSIYDEVLVEPNIMLPTNQASMRLPGTDGKAKMSKSLGNCIYLSDSAEDVWQKVRSMYTDPDHLRVDDPGKIEGNTVFTYLDAFCTDADFAEYWPEYKNLDELKAHYAKGGLGDMKCKKFLNGVINRMLEPMRVRRHELEQDIPAIFNILKEGSEAASEVAARTMDEVRKAMRIDYFNDAKLIQEQSDKYRK